MGEVEGVEFGDPLILAEFSLGEIRSFYDEARRHFGLRLAGLEARSKTVQPEDEESDYLDGRMEEVAGLLDLNEHFAVIGAYRTFEIFLRNVVDRLRERGIIQGRTKDHLDGLKDQLKMVGVDLTQPPLQWQEINKLRLIRNCIAHSGWVDGRHVSDLRDYTLPVEEEEEGEEKKGSPLRLPCGYSLEASALVASTCKLVIERCLQARMGRE